MAKTLHHFTIIISTRNAIEYVNKCIQSALSQNYPSFEVIFIDAQSTDGTYEAAKKYESTHNNIRVIQNEVRKYQGENLRIGTQMAQDKSICVSLDGDDWFAHDNVLARLNVEYNKGEVWMTYGTYAEYFGDNQPLGDVYYHYHAYPKEVIEANSFRQHKWLASHLRTWRKELFLKINEQDLKDDKTGDYVAMAPDVTFQFPMLEMSGHRSRYILDILYIYNRTNPLSESNISVKEQERIANQIRARKPYQPLTEL